MHKDSKMIYLYLMENIKALTKEVKNDNIRYLKKLKREFCILMSD